MNKDKDKFSEEIKRTLEDAPFFEPTDQMMAQMERRLDAHNQEPQTRRVAWWWLLLVPLFSLPFLFSTIYFYQQSQNSQQLDSNSNTQVNLNPTTDSAAQHHVTIFYDTIYQTVYQNEIISETPIAQKTTQNSNASALNSNPYAYRRSNTWPEQSAYSLPLLNSISSKLIPNLSPTNTYGFSENTASSLLTIPFQEKNIEGTPLSIASWKKPLSEINLLPISPLLPNPYALEEEWNSLTLEDLKPHKKTSRERLLAMAPIGLNAGLNIMPLFSFGTPGGTGFNFAYGAHGEVVFRNNLRLGIGFNILDLTNKTNQNFSDYPPISLEKPQDVIKELYINLTYLEVPVYFRYSFRADKRFQPFVNLGMVARRALKQNFEYELEGSTGEYKRLVTIPATNFSISTVQAGIGLEFPIFKNLYASPQLLYKHNYKIPALEKVKINTLGLDLGLQYHF